MLQFRSAAAPVAWYPASGFARCCLRSRFVGSTAKSCAVTGDQQGRQLVDGWLRGAGDVDRGQRDNRFRVSVASAHGGECSGGGSGGGSGSDQGLQKGAHGDLRGNRFEGLKGFLGHLGSGFCCFDELSFGIRPALLPATCDELHTLASNGDWRRRSGFARGVFHHQTQPPRVTPQSRHHRRVLAHVDHRCRPGRAGAGVQHHFQLPLQPLVDLFRVVQRLGLAGISVVDSNGCPKIASSPASHGAQGRAARSCAGWGGEPPWHLLVAGRMKVKGPGVASGASGTACCPPWRRSPARRSRHSKVRWCLSSTPARGGAARRRLCRPAGRRARSWSPSGSRQCRQPGALRRLAQKRGAGVVGVDFEALGHGQASPQAQPGCSRPAPSTRGQRRRPAAAGCRGRCGFRRGVKSLPDASRPYSSAVSV